MNVEIVKELKGWNGDAVLVKRDDGKHFVVSSVVARDTGRFETLAFVSNDAEGMDIDFMDVAGGRGETRESVIRELETLELKEQ